MPDDTDKKEDSAIAEMGIEGRDYQVAKYRSDPDGDGGKMLLAMAWKGDEPKGISAFNGLIFRHLEALYSGHITYEDFGKLVEIDIDLMKKL